ncbi:DUF5675 family protein [Sphingobacterium allocomposti]|uniref:DUF5675 family protein n=1 Tax=Sphingobacterium allocomposti TaxID=415956 RepID=UPI003CC6102D
MPEGRYKPQRRQYPRHGEQIGLPNVLNREAILIHPANNALKELLGCIAPVTALTGEGQGTGSRAALTLSAQSFFYTHYTTRPRQFVFTVSFVY